MPRRSRRGWRATRSGIVERELRLGPSIAAAHAARLAELGYADDARAGRRAAGGRPRHHMEAGGSGPRRVERGTSCWWRTPPTCRPPRRRGATPSRPAAVSSSDNRFGVGRLGGAGADALEDRSGQEAAPHHEQPGVVEGGHGGRPGSAAENRYEARNSKRHADLARHGVERRTGGEALWRQRGGGGTTE